MGPGLMEGVEMEEEFVCLGGEIGRGVPIFVGYCYANHDENLNTNPQIKLSRLSRIRNLHLQGRKASATKSLVSKQNK
jgi:hypothetical protein